MINLDPYIMEFISGNWMAMTIFLTLLKGVAILTPSATDNKIHALLTELFGMFRGKRIK